MSDRADIDARPFMAAPARRFMEALFATPRLAHHPDCACYDAHVLRCGPLILCLGCTCMAIGGLTTAGVLTAGWLRGIRIPGGWTATLGMATLGLVLYAPTLVQPFCQRKAFKIVARTLLGAAVVLLATAGLLLPPLDVPGLVFRVAFAVAFRTVCAATLRQRARFTPDPCARCRPTTYPFCAGNRRRVATLLDELHRSAGPGDEAFLAFAAALTGDPTGPSVELMALRPSHATCSRVGPRHQAAADPRPPDA